MGSVHPLITRRNKEAIKVGLLINLEAVDKAGKTTQARNVAHRLREAGLTAAGVRFPERPSNATLEHPSHFSTGILIDRYFAGKLILFEGRDTLFRRESLASLDEAERTAIAGIIEEKLFQVIMSINRREGHEGPTGVLTLLATHDVVVVERALSAQAYGPATGVSPVMIKALEGDLPSPDVTFLLDIDPAVARLRRTGETPDRYEANSGLQTLVRERYADMVRDDRQRAEREGREPRFVWLDASRPASDISDEIVATVFARLLHADSST